MTNLPQSVRRRLDAKTSSDHPDAGLLTAFAEQALDVSERERVLLHLATCAACREVVALAAPEAPPEEVTPLAPAWFRWPLLRWAAVAATAVIVWAAVAVLVPRTSVRDVSVPAPSGLKVESEQHSASAIPEAQVQVAPPPRSMKSREVARSQAPVAPPASNAPRQEMARDEQLDKTDNLAVHGTVGKLQTAPAPAANAVEFAKALPPPPAAATAKKSESAQANEAGALVAGVPAESKRKASVADMAARAQTVGGPLGKDSHGALIAGTITDPSGAVVPNAVVKITNAQTKDSTDVRTDSTGTYRAPVTPGVYSVEASSPGMQPVREKEITIDGMVAQNFTLHPGAAAETVEVTSEATALPAPPPPPLPQAERKAVIAAPGAGLAGGTTAELSQTYKGWLATPRWRVTPEGGLEHSVDGNSWTKPDAAPAGVLRAVAAIDSHVWAGGEGGALFHSSDGGRTWTRVRIGKKDAPLSDAITAIAIPNANSVLVSTAAGEQWSSTNGGRTWRLQSARH